MIILLDQPWLIPPMICSTGIVTVSSYQACDLRGTSREFRRDGDLFMSIPYAADEHLPFHAHTYSDP